MKKIVRNTLLQYLPQTIPIEETINPARIFNFNKKPILDGKIVYLCERELRLKDNFALHFVIQKSKELNKPFKILHSKISYEVASKDKFINNQILKLQEQFLENGFDFEIIDEEETEAYLLNAKIALLVVDFNPILSRKYLMKMSFKIYEIDGHNILPARFVSDKQEYNASTFRRKIYRQIYPFLTEYKNIIDIKNEADYLLEDFLQNKLQNYAELKNDPTKNVISGLSKYLNLGFISSQRVALEVIRSDATEINKETFLEELIIRKELADNFCLYAKSFKSLEGLSLWAKTSLLSHQRDIRFFIYNLEDLEKAKTHDKLWNKTQFQLMTEGRIHGYLRMYWAKKLLEWTRNPQEALNYAIYLNDKYAYDSPSANGYVGILWSIGGLHDRGFMDYPVTGKIRRMTSDAMKRKFGSNFLDNI